MGFASFSVMIDGNEAIDVWWHVLRLIGWLMLGAGAGAAYALRRESPDQHRRFAVAGMSLGAVIWAIATVVIVFLTWDPRF